MKFHLLTKAAACFVENLAKTAHNLSECKLTIDESLREFGFLVVYARVDGTMVAGISQDTFALECGENYKDAEKFLLNKINKLWNERE